MKFFGKIISMIGMLAGVLFLVHKAISWVYENTVQRYVTFDSHSDDER